MDPKAQSAANNFVFEDIEPFYEWHRDESVVTLNVLLPGFRRDQLKVQVTSASLLKISALRQITEYKWRRIYKEIPVPSDCDSNDIIAKFENGTLKIIFPKLITPTPSPVAKPQETTTSKPSERDEFDEKSDAKENQEDASEDTQKEKETPSDSFTEEKGKKAETSDDEVSRKIPEKYDKGVDKKKAKTSDDEVSGKVPEKSDKMVDEKKAKTSDDEVSGKVPEKSDNGVDEKKAKTSDAESDDFTKKNGKTVAAEATSNAFKAHEEKQRTNNFVTRTKTRMLDFTLSLRPAVDQDYRESLAGLVTGLKRMRKLMYLILVSLMVVVLGLYVKNAFKSSSSLGGSEAQEL